MISENQITSRSSWGDIQRSFDIHTRKIELTKNKLSFIVDYHIMLVAENNFVTPSERRRWTEEIKTGKIKS